MRLNLPLAIGERTDYQEAERNMRQRIALRRAKAGNVKSTVNDGDDSDDPDDPDDQLDSTDCQCVCAPCMDGHCESCSNPNCNDPACEHPGRTAAERQLLRLAHVHMANYGGSFPTAYITVCNSPEGSRLYLEYLESRGSY